MFSNTVKNRFSFYNFCNVDYKNLENQSNLMKYRHKRPAFLMTNKAEKDFSGTLQNSHSRHFDCSKIYIKLKKYFPFVLFQLFVAFYLLEFFRAG